MKIGNLLDPTELEQLIHENYITARNHPSLPLNILNYTPRAQFDRRWTRETIACRGLVVSTETGEVIAKGFDKFFNWGEVDVAIPQEPFVAYEKLDGSLALLWRHAVREAKRRHGLPNIKGNGACQRPAARPETP